MPTHVSGNGPAVAGWTRVGCPRTQGAYSRHFDELLSEARIGEGVFVHHMGHYGERARGDSRLRDWPDGEWRLVRQAEGPTAPRFITTAPTLPPAESISPEHSFEPRRAPDRRPPTTRVIALIQDQSGGRHR